VASGSGGGASMAENGERIFKELACNTCHADQPSALGPDLKNVFGNKVLLESGATVVADESYLRESILEPREKVVRGFKPVMPTYASQISEIQIMQLIEYIKSLSQQSENENGDGGRSPVSGE